MGFAKKEKVPALNKAMDILSRQDHSEKKLREKLMRRGYDEDEIEDAIAYLEEHHYLDDKRSCEYQFSYFYESSAMSTRQIVQKLYERGFDTELIRSFVPEGDEHYERELRCAAKVFQQKYRRVELPEEPDERYKLRDKMKAFLYRRGFSPSVIDDVVSDWVSEKENENIDEDIEDE